MIIHRILNNNAVMCFNENNEEVIIKGKGVAYRKKAGDELDKEKIEKVFVCDSKETTVECKINSKSLQKGLYEE